MAPSCRRFESCIKQAKSSSESDKSNNLQVRYAEYNINSLDNINVIVHAYLISGRKTQCAAPAECWSIAVQLKFGHLSVSIVG